VYSCGFLACYLLKYPYCKLLSRRREKERRKEGKTSLIRTWSNPKSTVCGDPNLAAAGPEMVQRTLHILSQSQNIWPLATRWVEHLERFSKDTKGIVLEKEGSMADSVSVATTGRARVSTLTWCKA
jgi:hypothetical protein